MFSRPMTRLAITAAAAGTICALGASAAFAAPTAGWSGPSTVPGAITNDSPGISGIIFNNVPNGQGIIVGWRGRGEAGPIFYKYRVPGLNKGKWSATGEIPGLTSSAPALGFYRDPVGSWAVLAVWTGHSDHHIWYDQGIPESTGKIAWTKETYIPKTVNDANSTDAPAVLFTDHAYKVIVAWRGPANHVRFTVGTPSGRGFGWSQSTVVTGPTVTPKCTGVPCTGATPGLAEVNASSSSGTVYFFWRQYQTTAIMYSTTTDTSTANLAAPTFTGPTQVPGAASLDGPAVSDAGQDGFGALLLAYKGVGGTHVRFQSFTSGPGWTAPTIVPTASTGVGPALYLNVLASTTPATDGNIILHHFTG
jgi:hypothetical protein